MIFPIKNMLTTEKINEDNLKVLHLIDGNPRISQRGVAQEMDFSLGKANYCIKALIQIGFIKLKNFSQSNNKTRYLYVLTPKGAKEKKVLTTEFLKRKQLEYEKLYNYFN
jgi:EPS-associated MarR family transcriptional regulator|tara:strand:+ start:2313 stop:2642 length:330 start_codon:yes stop_codon:yes gene_type:complete